MDDKVNTLQTLSEMIGRAQIAAKLGVQFGGDRNLYDALGYKAELKFADFYAQFQRQDIAKAIIDRPIKTTWMGDVNIMESTDPEDTKLEKAWKELMKSLKLKKQFIKLDKLTGLGRYGVLLMGLSDVTTALDWQKPITSKSLRLLYVRVCSETQAKIDSFEKDVSNPRYGLPLMYSINITAPGKEDAISLKVHYSRILHVVEDSLENEWEGTPRLEVVFNRLQDLEKLVGGSAEMYWKGARPGYQGKIDPDFTMSPDSQTKLQDQVTEYEHNLRRILINQGVDLQTLETQISDPSNHVDIQLQMISAVTGIPKRILTGSERGELSSDQDADQWASHITSRREEFVEPSILRPFIDKCMELGILPGSATKDVDYTISWKSLYNVSEKDNALVGLTRAQALKEYTSNAIVQSIIPPDAFLQFFLGLTTTDIELIAEMRDVYNTEMMSDEALTEGEDEDEDEDADIDDEDEDDI